MEIFKVSRPMKMKPIYFAFGFLVFSVVMRLTPHLPNMAPIGALALFSGVYLKRRYGFLVPVLALLASDLFIGFYDLRLMAVVYGSFALAAVIGWLVRKNKNVLSIALGTLGGSIIFFLTTNFAVWLFSDWYAENLSGLIMSYTLALPFFRNSLMGDIFYTAVFFGLYELAPILAYKLKIISKLAQPKFWL